METIRDLVSQLLAAIERGEVPPDELKATLRRILELTPPKPFPASPELIEAARNDELWYHG